MAFERKDPYHGYNFLVEIDGLISAGFKDCSGLDTTQEPHTYREGTDAELDEMRKIPGLVNYSNITLNRGITDNRELWEWRKQVADGAGERKNMSIVMMDDQQNPLIRWNLRNCWPTKWSGPSLDATSDELAIESLEIAHEGLSME